MENHLVSLHVCSVDTVFFLIFPSLSLFFLVTVLVLFWCPFHAHSAYHLFFLLWLHSIFFFNLIFWFSSFYSPIPLEKKNPLHVSLFFFIFPFFFSFLPTFFLFHSIGTREVVTQKELGGLVPVRDLRLDPSLLCSIPLLALSPNLLIVWLFHRHSIPGGQVVANECLDEKLVSHKKNKVPAPVQPPCT